MPWGCMYIYMLFQTATLATEKLKSGDVLVVQEGKLPSKVQDCYQWSSHHPLNKSHPVLRHMAMFYNYLTKGTTCLARPLYLLQVSPDACNCMLLQGYIRLVVFLMTLNHSSPLKQRPLVVSEGSPTSLGGGTTSSDCTMPSNQEPSMGQKGRRDLAMATMEASTVFLYVST